MAKSWMNTLKSYFSMLNQLEIEGDVRELEIYYQGNQAGPKEMERIQRGRDNLKYRNATPVKCKTVVKNIKILSEQKGHIEVLLHNYVWKLYHIDHHFMEQEDEQFHQISLREQTGNWFIASDHLIGKEEINSLERTPEEEAEGEEAEEDSTNVSVDPVDQGSKRTFDRAKVKRYAEVWWNRYNPAYPKFEVDCTNYVSQCLHEGGLTMEHTARRGKGWWVKGKTNWSYSWSVAHSLMNYLLGANTKHTPKGQLKQTADELMVGDVICYDWDGSGNYQHNTVVVAKDPNGMPLVNAHTVNSRHRYWDYRDSHAWTKNTQYKFIHITQ
ncbi:amidase domain-containing protein [Ammoniphilus sp. CFH 90114]|uniref:amidase domain-containing protein n=1 Tax=Ammoniphilus sp. CFH 90114 TaxID=2493665 RepID=UPI00100F7C23|nr:amidase domain-containing protein [Ammoniphilus sp. CFH 90114]RXT04818.1 hypothetical protein EIZ39_19005 [Ammoniphilus sp. CFH 90114]